MWQFIWDIIGWFVDNTPKWVKILIPALIGVIVFFFFGLRPAVYAVGGIFWFMFLFMLIAHVVINVRDRRKQREEEPPPIPVADQADISEFQEAMRESVGAEAAQSSAQPRTDVTQAASPSVRQGAPPTDLPTI